MNKIKLAKIFIILIISIIFIKMMSNNTYAKYTIIQNLTAATINVQLENLVVNNEEMVNNIILVNEEKQGI